MQLSDALVALAARSSFATEEERSDVLEAIALHSEALDAIEQNAEPVDVDEDQADEPEPKKTTPAKKTAAAGRR